MYRFDWLERLKLNADRRPLAPELRVSPVIFALGTTSFLTDISAEMVASVLPVYLYAHLKLGPLRFGLIDALYNGFAVVIASLLAGYLADRNRWHKATALSGYVLSALCKPALLAAGAAWGWILLIVGFDRLGKGIRTAPRDAILSMNAAPGQLASAFAVHRALDAAGALLGPIVAFAILASVPGAFDIIWIVSFGFAVLGVAVLSLFVRQPRDGGKETLPDAQAGRAAAPTMFRLARLGGCAVLLATATVSDGFMFLQLHERSGAAVTALPLYFVAVSLVYMLASIPVGLLADRIGRKAVLLGGYSMMLLAYAVLLTTPLTPSVTHGMVFVLMGLYYAGTEGVLMAMGSSIVPVHRRTLGLALLATMIGLGKAISSITFGWVAQVHGSDAALLTFALLLCGAISAGFALLRAMDQK